MIHKIHYISGLIITIFVGAHLINHTCSILGADQHMEVMNTLRLIYRHILIESVLLLAVLVQIISGLKLFIVNRKKSITTFEKLHIWTGMYLAVFFIIHVGAVLAGRFLLHLDTNFYFGVAGLNTFPLNIFFIPYYSLAIISFFGHIASIHRKKMNKPFIGITPVNQSKIIFVFGIGLTILIFYGLTNHFNGVSIPKEFEVLTGK